MTVAAGANDVVFEANDNRIALYFSAPHINYTLTFDGQTAVLQGVGMGLNQVITHKVPLGQVRISTVVGVTIAAAEIEKSDLDTK